MGIGVNELLGMLRRWWWLLAIALLAGGITGRIVADARQPLYASTAQVIVNPRTGGNNFDFGTIQGIQGLAETYRQLITTWPVLQPVVDTLGPPYTLRSLEEQVTTTLLPNSMLIQITVSDANAANTATIANAIAASFQQYIAAQTQSLNVDVTLAVPAQIPTKPYAPRTSIYIALGAIFGALLATAFVALREWRDDSIRSVDEAVAASGYPVLGVVSARRKRRKGASDLAHVPATTIESFRALRTQVLQRCEQSAHIRVVVTSPVQSSGQLLVTVHLGLALAQTGRSVLLIDADLKQPTLHNAFQMANDAGLATLLQNPSIPWTNVIMRTTMPNLAVLTTGRGADRAVDLIDSERWPEVLGRVASTVDVVLIHAPNLAGSFDAVPLSRPSDGSVIVCDLGATSASDLRSASGVLGDAGVRVLGIVLNEERRRLFGGRRVKSGFLMTPRGSSAPLPAGSNQPPRSTHAGSVGG